MPRLSLWKEQKSNDYRFIDRTISEMFTVGATDLYVHKYIGTNNPTNSEDLTLPHYTEDTVTNIQDLLFLENRDRKYDSSIYRLRGHYNVQNLDFDLSQFGLFLTNDIIFVTVHYNDMIDVIGRKLMVGDVFELPHLTDYHPLNETIPIGLRRYYQITDASFASEGFSQTWWPHLWRVKCEPLVDAQEFQNILNQPINKDNYMGDWDPTKVYPAGYTFTYGDKNYLVTTEAPAGTAPPNTTYFQELENNSLSDIISRYKKNLEINDAAIAEAARLVPKSGYDRSQLYIVPTYVDGEPAPPVNLVVNAENPITGTITSIHNPLYANPSTALQIPASALANEPIYYGAPLVLRMGMAGPELTSTGSGPVVGSSVLVVTPLPTGSTGPYGTADNTFAEADQYIEFVVTANETQQNVTTINLVEIVSFLSVGLVLRATVYSSNGTPITVLPAGTTILSINNVAKTITVSNPTLSYIPAGTAIEVAYNFTGTVTPDMNYLADCDPAFQYIKRSSPRSFGWTAGYLSGDDQAPNGEPLKSGISFPSNPMIGDYFLRLDYLPQKLFRFDGKLWVQISQNVRTPPTLTDSDKSLISTFINNNGTISTAQGGTIPSKQGLSTALKIRPD